MPKTAQSKVVAIITLAVIFLVLALLFIRFFESLPNIQSGQNSLAIDWEAVYRGITIRPNDYSLGFRLPPWTMLMVTPLALLSFAGSWAVMNLLVITAYVLSIPRSLRQPRYSIALLLLISSYSALRVLADGNFEGFVILGVVLCTWAYPRQNPALLVLGVLLATAKIQLSFVYLLGLLLLMLSTWSRANLLKSGLWFIVVFVPCLLWGGAGWFESLKAGTGVVPGIDISLQNYFWRLGLPLPLYLIPATAIILSSLWALWRSDRRLTPEKVGLLIAASLLGAPYVGGNGLVVVLALGVVPLLGWRVWIGVLLFALVDVQYVLPVTMRQAYGAYYVNLILLLTWAILLWRCWAKPASAS